MKLSHSTQYSFYKLLNATHGVRNLHVPTRMVKNIRGAMYRYDYKVIFVKKGPIISIIDVIKR